MLQVMRLVLSNQNEIRMGESRIVDWQLAPINIHYRYSLMTLGWRPGPNPIKKIYSGSERSDWFKFFK